MVVKLKKKVDNQKKRPVKRRPRDFSFRSIGGYDSVKQEIQDAIVMPMKHPSIFKRLKVRAPKGILLWGAPGVGKTLFARSIASECNARFYHVRSADIMSEWFGVSERRIKQLFQGAKRSRPAIIFFDELESLAPNRQAMAIEDGRTSLLASLLSEMDGFEPLNQVTVLAATNIPNRLDAALLRPGRFDRLIYVPLPNLDERKQILQIHLSGKPIENISVKYLAERTKHFSGADLELLVNSATTNWLKKFIGDKTEKLSVGYFESALGSIKPSVRPEDVRYYEYLRNTYERSGGTSLSKSRSEGAPSYYG
ncbi:MAG: ATP-binding protein [Nitrososphaerales archaeon]